MGGVTVIDTAPIDPEFVRTADEWAEDIKSDLTGAVDLTISGGQKLIAAKMDVKHGEWLPMLEKIGISDVWAGKLMRIATNPELSNPNRGSDLPSSVKTLYELSRLSAEQIEDGITSGDIMPDMTIQDAKNFARPQPERKPTVSSDRHTDHGAGIPTDSEPEPIPRPSDSLLCDANDFPKALKLVSKNINRLLAAYELDLDQVEQIEKLLDRTKRSIDKRKKALLK